MQTNTKTPAVIDSGGLFTKVGIAGESSPSDIFPTVVGRFRSVNALAPLADLSPQPFIGEEAVSKRGICRVTRPVVEKFPLNLQIFI
jgi:actin-related protein